MSTPTTTRIMRPREWAHPIPSVRREVVSARSASDEPRPPILFVPGYAHAAWVFLRCSVW
jgi:hypothetical protein